MGLLVRPVAAHPFLSTEVLVKPDLLECSIVARLLVTDVEVGISPVSLPNANVCDRVAGISGDELRAHALILRRAARQCSGETDSTNEP